MREKEDRKREQGKVKKGRGRLETGGRRPGGWDKAPADMIWGRKPVLEWLESGLAVKDIMLSRDAGGGAVSNILKIAEHKKIAVKRLHPAKLDQIAGTDKHQNIIARVELPEYAELDALFDVARKKDEPPLMVLLDGVQDPHNLGAILRSADAAGLHGVIIPKDKAVGLTPAVVKASAGAAAWMPLVQVTNLSRTIDQLKEQGVWITGTADDASTDFTASDFKDATAIILGSEGKGIRRLLREKCDFLVRIPMFGHVSSLNVSVAAGLLFFEARQQRGHF